MLDSLRAFSRTWIAKILLAVLVVSFGIFGINNVVTGIGANTVARVGDEDISLRDFQRAYEQQLNAAGQQLGRIPTGPEAVALGLPNNAIGLLAGDAAIDSLGARLGLGASEERLAELIRQDPNFGGTLGQFQRENFVAVLRQAGFTEAEYLAMKAKDARRQQLVSALFADAHVPQVALDIVNRYTKDQRTVDYFIVNDTAVPPVAEPTEDELKAYLAANQSSFRTLETRTVDVLSLSPAILAKTITVSEEAIAAEYERTKANLTKAEKRTIRQVVLPDDAAAAAFETGKTAGTPFETLVQQVNLPITELGTLGKAEVLDPAVADAAFGLEAGGFVIIPGVQGKRVIQVSAIQPGGEIPLAEARARLVETLALAEARKQYADVLDQVEELRAAFQPLPEIAERFKLPLASVGVTASGAELAAAADIPEAGRSKVATAIFAAKPEDKLTPSVALDGQQQVWFDLKSVDVARDQTLDEVRDAVIAGWTRQKTDEAVAAEVDKITAQLKSGATIADLAVSVNQFPQISQPMTRTGDGTPVFDASVASAIFAGGADHYGSARNQDGDYVIFRVVDILPAEGEGDAANKSYVENTTRDGLYSLFITALRNDAGVKINQAALNQLLALDATPN